MAQCSLVFQRLGRYKYMTLFQANETIVRSLTFPSPSSFSSPSPLFTGADYAGSQQKDVFQPITAQHRSSRPITRHHSAHQSAPPLQTQSVSSSWGADKLKRDLSQDWFSLYLFASTITVFTGTVHCTEYSTLYRVQYTVQSTVHSTVHYRKEPYLR